MPHPFANLAPRALPSNPPRLLRRAQTAQADGDAARAERLYNAVLGRDPQNFDALHGLGRLQLARGRLDTALVLFQSALKCDMSRADGFADLGLVFHLLRRFADAIRSYDAGLALAPQDAGLLNRRGAALIELGRSEEALLCFERILADAPDHVDALGNYGNVLLKLNRPDEALAAYDRALGLAPHSAQVLTNRAVALRRLDRPQEAMIGARRALALAPDFAPARFVEAVACLTLGDFAAGWAGYEARWQVGILAAQRRNFAAPLWLGRETPGLRLDCKTILLHAEQGFGDAIQFVRYASRLAGQGAKVIVEARRALLPLLSGLRGVAAVVAHGDPLPDVDLHCPLLSLPLSFGTTLDTIPADVPYLEAPAARIAAWRDRLPAGRPLIGLAWAGERTHDNDLNRSISPDLLAPLLAVPDVTFVSLQHELREGAAAALRRHANLILLDRPFSDFADTAAVVARLDAVVSVDTAVAHLAGAMGKPLSLLLPFAADFRWLRERSDSPWYPTARLYRQPRFGDWPSALAGVANDLARADFSQAKRRLSA